MKVYLASAFSRQTEMRFLARELAELRIEVTSRWLYELGPANPNDPASVAEYRRETAFMDVQDVRAADMLIRFTDQVDGAAVSSRLISGGRMFEFGMAWERGIPVIVVGGKQNVFDSLPNVIHLPDKDALIRFLTYKDLK